MAHLYRADLTPTKLELIAGWAPRQPWFVGDAGAEFTNVSAYRFDDPEGEVGIESILIRAGVGPLLQVPLTYRDAPLAGAESWLIGTSQHSVLGKRWVYDAVGDPAYIAAAATAALTGGSQAEQWIETDGELIFREPNAVVSGSGSSDAVTVAATDVGTVTTGDEVGATVIEAGSVRLVVVRVPVKGDRLLAPGAAMLIGTWIDQPEPTILATVERL
jgi:Maltokinase N-terminal cap domain